MSDLVAAWNKETGKKHPFLVPKHWINHPTLRPPLTDEPVPKLKKASAPAAKLETKNEGEK